MVLSVWYPAKPQPMSMKTRSPARSRRLRLPKQGNGRGHPRVPARAVEVRGVDRTLAEPDQPEHDLGLEHAEPDEPLVALLHHQGVEPARQLRLAHPPAEDLGHALLEHAAVDRTRPLHQGELIRALDRAGPEHLPVEAVHVPEREVLPEALVDRDRHLLGLEVDRRGDPRHARRGVPVTPHGPDLREERLVLRPLVAPPDPEAGLAVAGDEQHAVLHGAREVEEVDLAEDGGELPPGVRGIHQAPEPLEPVRELARRDFRLHAIRSWAAPIYGW
jgi:hypothetical protein